MSRKNPSLAQRLRDADVYDEFCVMMFGMGMRYDDLLEKLEEWGISGSYGALHRFSESEQSNYVFERARREQQKMLEDNSVDLDEAQRRAIAERLYILAVSPNISEKALIKMKELEIKQAQLNQDSVRLQQSERKLDMLERKLGLVDEAMESQELTDAEKVARWQQIFGR